MILELRERLAPFGLRLHPSKCKVQSNTDDSRLGDVEIDTGFSVNFVTAEAGLKILGVLVTLDGTTSTELNNRIASAMGKIPLDETTVAA